MRIVLVVPGGVDPPGGERIIPFVHDLVQRLSAQHHVRVLALGHDPTPGSWQLFDAHVVNIPIGAHGKGDIARVLFEARRHADDGGRPDVIHALWANLPGLAASTVGRQLGLVHVGSLNRVKDQDLLLRGVAAHLASAPHTRLTMVGADTLDGHHRRLAHELGIADRVTFTGWLPPAEVAEVLRTAAWHVLTSHHDAGPLAVVEAAACGVPTVGTPVGHVADWTARPAPAAITIDHRSPTGVAEALARATSPGVREQVAPRALAWATAHDADATTAAFTHLYRRLVAS